MNAARRLTLATLVSLCAVGGVQLLGAASAFAGPEAPTVEEAFVTNVASTSVTLHARINPQGAETSYTFEYAPAGGVFVPVPEPEGSGSAGEGAAGVLVEVHIQQGLAPNASYEFRVVVSNSVQKEVSGVPVSFTTQAAGGTFVLPDGRQWEMVSPPSKHGADIAPISEAGLIKAAANGDAITYWSGIPTEAEPQGFSGEVQNLATHDSAGWQSRDLTVPHAQETGAPTSGQGEYWTFSEDLSLAVVQPLGQFTPCENAEGAPQPCLSPEASEQTAFLSTDFFSGDVNEPCLPKSTHCARPLVSGCPVAGEPCPRVVEEHADVPPGTRFGGLQSGPFPCPLSSADCGPLELSTSPDLSHVVLLSETPLTVDGSANYEYEWSAGKLTPQGLDVLPVSEGGDVVVAGRDSALANDGSYFFSDGGHLYLRDFAKGESVRVDVAQGVAEPANADATFLYSSSDASKVLFSDPEQLTAAAGGGIYECRIAQAAGKPTCELELTDLESSDLSGVSLGHGEDLSDLYFLGAEDKLYVEHYNGTEWTRKFIAALSSEDETDWKADLSTRPLRVSPNGEWLAFMAQAPLTGYDNRDAVSGRTDAEVYLYHASSGTLACASCEPTGARPTGVEYEKLEPDSGGLVGGPRGTWISHDLVAANLPGWQRVSLNEYPDDYQSRYLSSSGRLFFNSLDALVPQDVNATEDVYEYEPEGVPAGERACSSSSTSGSEVFKPTRAFEVEGRKGEEGAGCVALISSGSSSEESAFLDASESGGDVFFLTSAKLASQDQDTSLDIYDAHECSAQSPCLSAPVPPPPCDTEASCKPSPTLQPSIYGAPSSATFSGPGNLAPPPPAVVKKVTNKTVTCKKGLVKKRVKKKEVCVKKSKNKHKAKKSAHTNRRAPR